MIVVLEHDAGLGLRRVRMRDRLLARIRAAALDAELAAGASPESSVVLALHAVHLCGPSQRRLLAGSLAHRGFGRRPDEVAAEGARVRPRGPPRRYRTAGRHRSPRRRGPGQRPRRGPVRCLLADGTGPIYRKSAPDRLRNELRAALAVMDPYA